MPALAVVSRSTDHDADDLDLVAGVRAGDDRAFEVLYARYGDRITAYVRGMVHDHGRAEDVTQEVFMSALRRMRATDATIAFKPWIYEIAKNACIDAWRRTRNLDEVSFDAKDALGSDEHGRLADPGVTPDTAIDTKDALDNLCGAFGGLSQTHHKILVLREFEGLSYREIGERLGMSRPGVESTLFRARKRLSEEYEELVSGERCLRVQRIIDSPGGRAAGLRDQRRMARHLSHCQPCRRYARLAGVDLGVPARPAAAAATKIAAWFPLPLFLRRRWGGDEAGQLVGHSHSGPVAQWSASLASTLDPGTVSGWSKAVATAATVAVAGVGAGAAIHEHRAIESLLGKPAVLRHAPAAGPAARAPGGGSRGRASTRAGAQRSPAVRAGARNAGSGLVVDKRLIAPRQASPVPSTTSSHGTAAGAGVATPVAPRSPQADHGSLTAGLPEAVGSAGHPAGSAPTGLPADPAQQPIGQVLDTLGGGAAAGPDTADPASPGAATIPDAPVASPVDALVGRAGDVVGGGATSPAAAPAKAAPHVVPTAAPVAPATPTALVASVGATVTSTLATTAAGRLAP
jgi:RNA polymerase sigma factor (sigma-70 family)